MCVWSATTDEQVGTSLRDVTCHDGQQTNMTTEVVVEVCLLEYLI